MAETGRLLQAARSPVGLSSATARAYAASWRAFVRTQPADSDFPVGTTAVAAWLEARAKAGRPRQSLVVDRAALTAWCAANGEGLDVALPTKQVRRTGAGVDAASLLAVARRCGPDLSGLRDRVLLLLAAALDIGAEALARLTIEDITDTTDGMTVALLRPRSGRHQLRRLRRRRDPAVCPVRHWAAWRDAAQLRWGAAFRGIDVHGTVGDPLSVPGIRFVLDRALGRLDRPAHRARRTKSGSPPESSVRAAARRCTMRAAPDWVQTTLTVSGPVDAVARFRVAAQGPGIIPWQVDFDYEQARLLAPMAGKGAQAATLARLLREASERLHRIALQHQAAGTPACAFDLHRLVPVPGPILEAGADSRAAAAWLQAHWGTLLPLRRVEVEAPRDQRARRSARLVYRFWSAEWTPWQALERVRTNWPELVFDIRPQYARAGTGKTADAA
ncbi:transposase [Komagataeibacter xylinus NBRC 13693]|uniref:Transposase n=1 Tax=Komagataeibacter xylinus NBRC 13693 TaxID=1234668 RepID=A0A0D6QCL9_KOMXY|nr:transposase [Komagataeibacter xylinus]GAO01099.1 transposase [Komagataeibacter xylinus NBRC 13693]